MQNSKAYDCLIKQLNANGSEKNGWILSRSDGRNI